jgi:acyl dehydratase
MTTAQRSTSTGPAAQRRFKDVTVGEELTPVSFPITVYRLVMAAGASRDFNSIHHNTEYAQSTGAREMYANTTFLLGMWERAVRDWIGPAGTIHSITGFRMRSFNYAGDTTTVTGKVVGLDGTMIRIELASSNSSGITVGPGIVTVSLPA